ncbi:MAG: hypothetical protein HXY20_07210 [Acidobacteria bacterium]|nr:hypothetical protein [Acidobacteriota bacterium]
MHEAECDIADTSLELSPDRMREVVDQAMVRIVSHISSLPEQPSADIDNAAAVARSLAEPLPECGIPFPDVLSLLFEGVIPISFNTAVPGRLGYIPGEGLFQSALDDLISDAVNRYFGVWAAARLRRIPRIEIVAEPQLSIPAFRLVSPGAGIEGENRLNRVLLDRINSRKRVFLTATTLAGRLVIRICVLSFRTHADRMQTCVEDIEAAVGELEPERWRIEIRRAQYRGLVMNPRVGKAIAARAS